MFQRCFLSAAGRLSVGLCRRRFSSVWPTMPARVTTFAYRKEGSLTFLADAYTRDDGLDTAASSSSSSFPPQPLVLHFHGGGMIFGNRASWAPHWLIEPLVAQRGWTLLSVDYRLLPEARTEDMLDDVRWLWSALQRGELNSQLASHGLPAVDTQRVVVSGASGGGYPAVQAGNLCRSPSPRAIVDLYGVLLATTDWYGRPHPELVLPVAEEAIAALLEPGHPVITSFPIDYTQPRCHLYRYLIKHGLHWRTVTGLQSTTDIPKEKLQLLPVANVSSSYPPTAVLHGTADASVPVSDSDALVKALQSAGVKVEYHRLEGREHGVDGADDSEMQRVKASIVDFIIANTA
jgi:acetyl esterase/lipase